MKQYLGRSTRKSPGNREGRRPQTVAVASSSAGNFPDWNPELSHAGLRRAVAAGSPVAVGHMLELQQLYGNRYVQRLMELSESDAGDRGIDPEVESAIERRRGGGHALPEDLRTHMETALDHDFRDVRVHTD